jgi:5'-deoxynucleotidase YfbR-like HD superfamily hydrolase
MVNHVQCVAMHTINCQFIAVYIADVDKVDCDRGLLMLKTLFHDFPEGQIGDIPAPTRDHDAEIHAKIKEIEKTRLHEIYNGLPVDYREYSIDAKQGVEGEIVRLADLIERLIYLHLERKSGNRNLDHIFKNTIVKFKSKEIKSLLKKYPTASEIIFHYLSKVQA